MKPQEFKKTVLKTILNFKHSVQGKTFILYNNLNEIMSIKFPKLIAFNFLKFNNKIKYRNGSYYSTLAQIIDSTYNEQIYQISKEKRNDILLQSEKINKLATITVSNVHSIIERKKDVYLVMSTKKGDIVLQLLKQKGDKISYIVIDVLDISFINSLLNDPDVHVSIPVRSQYLKYEGTEKEHLKIQILSKNEKLERLAKLREFLLEDLCENNNVTYVEYLDNVPIIKKASYILKK